VSQKHTVNKYQFSIADGILRHLEDAISPEYLGLVSTNGHSILSLSSPGFIDTDAVASLAASSYGATRQLARLLSESDFTMMFNEGKRFNVHIAQVSHDVLLVVCFRRVSDIGKIRMLTNRAIGALADVISRFEADHGDIGAGEGYAESAGAVVDRMLSTEGVDRDGTD
jgi:predicted regulator of Ras-like GTPase activity (Roadblock/LC7/MglB family)